MLLNVGLDVQGAGGLGASQHGFCVARIGVGGNRLMAGAGFHAWGGMGRWLLWLVTC